MVEAWFMDVTNEDQRLSHKTTPLRQVDLTTLECLGVETHFIEDNKNEILEKLKTERGYNYHDVVEICPEKLSNYEEKIKCFFDEHIHTDEEVRYILEGSGYFDIRDDEDNWIRIKVIAGDLIILPAGIYHRFTLDTKNYIKAMRLFSGEPVWTPYSRSELRSDNKHVLDYKQKINSIPNRTVN